MDTYDYEKVILDYDNKTIDVETATGHSLQHIAKLYGLQKAANISRYELRSMFDFLENEVKTLRNEVARLTELVEKLLTGGNGEASE